MLTGGPQYVVVGKATKDEIVVTKELSYLTVIPDPTTAGTYQSDDEKLLIEIDEALLVALQDGYVETRLGNRSSRRYSLVQLRSLRSEVVIRISRQQNIIGPSVATKNTLYVRF